MLHRFFCLFYCNKLRCRDALTVFQIGVQKAVADGPQGESLGFVNARFAVDDRPFELLLYALDELLKLFFLLAVEVVGTQASHAPRAIRRDDVLDQADIFAHPWVCLQEHLVRQKFVSQPRQGVQLGNRTKDKRPAPDLFLQYFSMHLIL
jgi:hypothetical protein